MGETKGCKWNSSDLLLGDRGFFGYKIRGLRHRYTIMYHFPRNVFTNSQNCTSPIDLIGPLGVTLVSVGIFSFLLLSLNHHLHYYLRSVTALTSFRQWYYTPSGRPPRAPLPVDLVKTLTSLTSEECLFLCSSRDYKLVLLPRRTSPLLSLTSFIISVVPVYKNSVLLTSHLL